MLRTEKAINITILKDLTLKNAPEDQKQTENMRAFEKVSNKNVGIFQNKE